MRVTEKLYGNEYERCNHVRSLAESLRRLAYIRELTGQKEPARPLAERTQKIGNELESPLPFDMPAAEAES